eukprot:229770-Rhodomonas_salina.1
MPTAEQVGNAKKLNAAERECCLQSQSYKAYSYFAQEKETEDEKIAKLFTLFEVIDHFFTEHSQKIVRRFAARNNQFGMLMESTPLAFFEENGYNMTEYKM